MSIFQKSNTTVYCKIQSGKGSAATIAGTDAIDPTLESGFIQPKGENIDRGLIRGTRWPSAQVSGGRWGEGPLIMELRGSGTGGQAPEFGPLLKTLFGTETINAAGTVNDVSPGVSEFDSDLVLVVGQLIRVEIGSGHEVRRVATKTGGGPTFTYTVNRAFSEAPANGADILAGVTYQHIGSEAELYATVHEYLDGLKLTCVDTVCEQLQIGVNEREVIRGTFNCRSLTCTESAATDGLTPSWDDTAPLIGTDCNLVADGSALNMKNLEIDMRTRRSRGGINSAGWSELPWMSKFEANVKIAPWVEDGAAFTKFFAATKVDIELVKGTAAGNIMAIFAEDLQQTGPSIGDDEGDFSWDQPLICTGGITIAFF